MRRLVPIVTAFCFWFCFAGATFAQQSQHPKSSRQERGQDGKTREDIAQLKKQIQELQQGQQQILEELKELRKVLESRTGEAPAPQQFISLNVYGEPFNGDPAAKVAIIEYSDFQCPYCGEYSRETYPRIVADYVKTGKVRYYFRDLPLPIHPDAMLAAQAARCAGEQGKFWEMHDSLFANQSALASKDLAARAQALGLDQGKFLDCLTSGKYAQAIRRSAAGAERMGINGTPGFAIGVMDANGDVVRVSQMMLGAESYDELKQVLDDMLSSQTKPAPGR